VKKYLPILSLLAALSYTQPNLTVFMSSKNKTEENQACNTIKKYFSARFKQPNYINIKCVANSNTRDINQISANSNTIYFDSGFTKILAKTVNNTNGQFSSSYCTNVYGNYNSMLKSCTVNFNELVKRIKRENEENTISKNIINAGTIIVRLGTNLAIKSAITSLESAIIKPKYKEHFNIPNILLGVRIESYLWNRMTSYLCPTDPCQDLKIALKESTDDELMAFIKTNNNRLHNYSYKKEVAQSIFETRDAAQDELKRRLQK
jgi:hypothetical protein